MEKQKHEHCWAHIGVAVSSANDTVWVIRQCIFCKKYFRERIGLLSDIEKAK